MPERPPPFPEHPSSEEPRPETVLADPEEDTEDEEEAAAEEAAEEDSNRAERVTAEREELLEGMHARVPAPAHSLHAHSPANAAHHNDHHGDDHAAGHGHHSSHGGNAWGIVKGVFGMLGLWIRDMAKAAAAYAGKGGGSHKPAKADAHH